MLVAVCCYLLRRSWVGWSSSRCINVVKRVQDAPLVASSNFPFLQRSMFSSCRIGCARELRYTLVRIAIAATMPSKFDR